MQIEKSSTPWFALYDMVATARASQAQAWSLMLHPRDPLCIICVLQVGGRSLNT